MLQFAWRVNFGVRFSYLLVARVVSQYAPEPLIEQILVRDIVCDIPRFEHVNNYKWRQDILIIIWVCIIADSLLQGQCPNSKRRSAAHRAVTG